MPRHPRNALPCRRPTLWLAAALVLLSAPAWASFDSPGQATFDFLADDQTIFTRWEDLPPDEDFSEGWADAYFSSDASIFGDKGAFVWLGFSLEGPDGPRSGMLLLDLDLERAPLDGVTPMAAGDVRATYLEKRGDQVLFVGNPVLGAVWIVDILFHEDDQGGVEGDFAFVFEGEQGVYPGSRAFLRGHFWSVPSPAQLRTSYDIPDEGTEVATYVDVGCGGELYWDDEDDAGGGCDCEGDSADDGSSGSDSCEGDSASSASTEASSCDGGDSGSSSSSCSGCEGDAQAAIGAPRRGGGPLRALQRWLPEIALLAGLAWLRRRARR